VNSTLSPPPDSLNLLPLLGKWRVFSDSEYGGISSATVSSLSDNSVQSSGVDELSADGRNGFQFCGLLARSHIFPAVDEKKNPRFVTLLICFLLVLYPPVQNLIERFFLLFLLLLLPVSTVCNHFSDKPSIMRVLLATHRGVARGYFCAVRAGVLDGRPLDLRDFEGLELVMRSKHDGVVVINLGCESFFDGDLYQVSYRSAQLSSSFSPSLYEEDIFQLTDRCL
jgi:hypothetical protein